MSNRDIIAIGTSAGGVEALRYLAKRFPPDFDASVLITIHISSRFESALDKILTHAGPLPAVFAGGGDVLEKRRVYIAPPERHLIVEGDRLWLGAGPRENNARPAIDPMFRSAALCCGARSIGVVLTGALMDGASGLWALKQSGGVTVVQDPSDADVPEMPKAALSRITADHVVRLAALPELLISLVQLPAGKPGALPDGIKFEVKVAKQGGGEGSLEDNIRHLDRIGRRSVFTCPDCGGVTWQIEEGDLVRYRCHVGHSYTAEIMALALDESLRRGLASALRALEERIALAQSLQSQANARQRKGLAAMWAGRAQDYQNEADIIRSAMKRADALASDFAKANSVEARVDAQQQPHVRQSLT